MRRFLALNDMGVSKTTTSFPGKFDHIPNTSLKSGFLSRNEVEKKILGSINSYNGSINVVEIQYLNLIKFFPNAYLGACTGLIIEERVDGSEGAFSSGDYVFNRDGRKYIWSIFAYVFITPSIVGARNSFVSQTIFPELFDYMERYISSPSYTLTNKPVFFINLSVKKVTAKSIIRNFAGLTKMGITYLEVFQSSYDPNKDASLPLDIFVAKHYEQSNSIKKTEWFVIDCNAKTFRVNTEKFKVGGYLKLTGKKKNYVGFHGSSEKFYVLNMLPLAIMAINEGYGVDLSELETVCQNKASIPFRKGNEKFNRLKTAYQYLVKLKKARE